MRFSLVDRKSRPAGSFREVRVRIDEASGDTRYTTLRLSLEGGHWVVVDPGALAKD